MQYIQNSKNMSLELSLIIGFLFHLIGDYIFQNDWIAQNKTKTFFPAFIHTTIYAIPFLILVEFKFWFIIYVTHFLIDRYRLAIYWIRLVNVHKLISFKITTDISVYGDDDILEIENQNKVKIIKTEPKDFGTYSEHTVTPQIEGKIFGNAIFPSDTNCGYWPDKPKWMAVWLMIIIDNSFHLIINSLCIILNSMI